MSEVIVTQPPQGYVSVGLTAKGEPVCEIKVYGSTPDEMIDDLRRIVEKMPATFAALTAARYGSRSSDLR